MKHLRMMLHAIVTSVLLTAPPVCVSGQPDSGSANEERYRRYLQFYTLVDGMHVRPHWYADGIRFWFAAGTSDSTIIYGVDPRRNTRTELFDNQRLRSALKQMLGHEPAGKGIPFRDFEFTGRGDSVQFNLEQKLYQLSLKNYRVNPVSPPTEVVVKEQQVFSADRGQSVFIRDNNLWCSNAAGITPLTDDGIKENNWIIPADVWSPSGSQLFVQRSDVRNVHHLPVIDFTNPVEKVDYYPYAKTGGALELAELFIIDVRTKRRVKIDTGKDTAQYIFPLGWRPDGSEVIFMRLSRDGRKLELLAADPYNGVSRIIVTEQQRTFVAGLDFILENWKKQFTMLRDGNRFIWLSERDGWRHLYLYDMNGKLIRQLTKGSFPVIQPVKADEKAGWIYFTANAETYLYATNLYRTGMNGGQVKRLTAGNYTHAIQFAPGGEYFLDTYSDPGSPPVTELHKADGRLLQVPGKADVSRLERIGYRTPENFVVKAADDSTDLYGILYAPFNLDTGKKYPVVEFIYGGPFTTVVPHGFMPGTSLGIQAQALAQLGYITFLVDGRGTTGRSKAFQDVVYGNIGKYEIPDHVAALRQLASRHPYMDLSRVGIYGHSWGGYFALRAMLTAPEVYKTGIASAPGELTEGAEINEPYMGLPQDNPVGYAAGLNAGLAGNLKGKLLFIHGTSDINAPLSTTIRMLDALIKAGKQYDLLLLPGQTHFFEGISDRYANDAIRRYFDEHLRRLK